MSTDRDRETESLCVRACVRVCERPSKTPAHIRTHPFDAMLEQLFPEAAALLRLRLVAVHRTAIAAVRSPHLQTQRGCAMTMRECVRACVSECVRACVR